MDDPSLHVTDDQEDITDDLQDIDGDDGDVTPADTEGGEPKNAEAEEVAQKQEESWLEKIKSGKKTLDDMPDNLGWLKERVEKKLEPAPKADESDIDSKIRTVLQEREAEAEFNYLVEDLQSSNITAEQEAKLREEYEELIKEFSNPTASQKLKTLLISRRLVGLKGSSEAVRERRHKGACLPPMGGKKRTTVRKDKMSEDEKKFAAKLPPGFKV